MSSRRPFILIAAFLLSGLIAYLNSLAFAHAYYFTYWWYDVMMHFLTGFMLGLFIYWGLFASGLFVRTPASARRVVWTVFLCVFAIGVAWEIFEYVNGLTQTIEGYKLDTMNDLILDSCGGILAALITTGKRHG